MRFEMLRVLSIPMVEGWVPALANNACLLVDHTARTK